MVITSDGNGNVQDDSAQVPPAPTSDNAGILMGVSITIVAVGCAMIYFWDKGVKQSLKKAGDAIGG